MFSFHFEKAGLHSASTFHGGGVACASSDEWSGNKNALHLATAVLTDEITFLVVWRLLFLAGGLCYVGKVKPQARIVARVQRQFPLLLSLSRFADFVQV